MDDEEERFEAVRMAVGDRKISVMKAVRATRSASICRAKDFIEPFRRR